jgi:tetratricopeptide (TPR) repeat protein
MAQQEQVQYSSDSQGQGKRPRRRPWVRWVVLITTLLLIAFGAIAWVESSQGSWFSILPILLFTVLGVVFSLLQWLFPISAGLQEHHTGSSLMPHASPTPAPVPAMPQIIVHVPTTQPLPPALMVPDKAAFRGILGFPPPTDSRTIQQREQVVKEVYDALTQPDITAIALTGIGGVGKSTLAALIHRYAEEQRRAGSGPFTASALWLRIDPTVTMTDLAGTLFEALGKPMLDLGDLTPQNLAVALFNALNATEEARLIVLDQFENLLDAQTGYALADHAGVGEWLDALNSQPCRCRVLLTSRLWPQGTREYPPTYMQEYHVKGMEIAEGIELLRKQGVGTEATEAELRTAVEHCSGHAFALTLLASFLRRNRSLSLAVLVSNPTYARLWTGDIARNLLDSIYTQQLNEMQRKLLLAFSIYREPVLLDAALALVDSTADAPGGPEVLGAQVLPALDALLRQHLLQAPGEGRYQLHTIVADYARSRFSIRSGEVGTQTLQAAHDRAARYYLQQAAVNCPPRSQRRRVSDVQLLIEATWQLCLAERWQEAYELMEQENIFGSLRHWGGNAILLELYELLFPLERWRPSQGRMSRIYNHLGEIYRALGQMEPAQQHLERALRLCRERGDRKGEGWALNGLGRIYSILGQRERAREYFEQALSICREIGDRGMEVRNLNNLAGVYRAQMQRSKAQEYCEQALSICREIGDRGKEATTLNNLGEVFSALGHKEQAREYYEEALSLHREVGNRAEESWTLNNLGKLYGDMEQLEQARVCLEQALSIRKEVGDRLGEGRTLKNLGKVYADLGQKELALAYLEQSLSISRELDRWGEGKTLDSLGRVYADLGQKERAQNYFEQALRIRREVGDRGGEAKTLYDLGKFYAELRQKGRALGYYIQALQVHREVGDRVGEGPALHDIGKLYGEREQYDIALACFLLAKNIFAEVESPEGEAMQKEVDVLREKIGAEGFGKLMADVEPRVEEIVEKMLRKGIEEG